MSCSKPDKSKLEHATEPKPTLLLMFSKESLQLKFLSRKIRQNTQINLL